VAPRKADQQKRFFEMSSGNLVEDFARIVSYCKTSKRRSQIMTEMSMSDIETEAFTRILIRQSLLEQNFNGYQTTKRGNSYLDTRSRIEVAMRSRV